MVYREIIDNTFVLTNET